MKKYSTIENESTLKMIFPYVSENGTKCEIKINFHKTLRIPDDNKKYNLPPSLGKFNLNHVDDYKDKLPESWGERGGVFLPMYQSEAMWISFTSDWPFAVKVASGKINAVSGKEWTSNLENNTNEETQDYMVVPSQPWLDGFNVSKGVIRQFVAVPLNSGFTVEEQIKGFADTGGIQIMVFPMKEDEYKKIEAKNFQEEEFFSCASMSLDYEPSGGILRSMAMVGMTNNSEMGFGAGGFMKQEIYKDEYGFDKWMESGQRVFVHLLNSLEYRNVTGKEPHSKPLEQKDYQRYGYTWYDYYSDNIAINGSKELSKVDSIASLEVKKDIKILDDNTSLEKIKPVDLGIKKIKDKLW